MGQLFKTAFWNLSTYLRIMSILKVTWTIEGNYFSKKNVLSYMEEALGLNTKELQHLDDRGGRRSSRKRMKSLLKGRKRTGQCLVKGGVRRGGGDPCQMLLRCQVR